MELMLRHSTDRPRLFMALCLAVILSVSGLILWIAAGASLEGLVSALCGPSVNSGPVPLLAMWMAMTLAMMIPSAAPMISTYLDIAEAAAAKRMAIVSPLVLAAGFGAVWLIFAFAAALAQWMVLETGYAGVFQGRFAGLGLIAAGAYQFTPLKHACLSKCRMPMPYFLAHWTDRPMGVFRMGLEQGLNCFGCCWALMSLSFVAGLMNLVWMGFLGVVMVLEKTLPQPKALSFGLGLGLIGAGVYLIVV
jgi:predicted metal-binding membrane protein